MIPGKIIRFLEDRANTAFAGTRDGNLVPRGYRVSGWQIDADGRTMTVLIPSAAATPLVDALLENSRIACTFEEVGTHETYQIKGRYLSHRPARPAEIEKAVRELRLEGIVAKRRNSRYDERCARGTAHPSLHTACAVDGTALVGPTYVGRVTKLERNARADAVSRR